MVRAIAKFVFKAFNDLWFYVTHVYVLSMQNACFPTSNQDKWNMKPMIFNIRGQEGTNAVFITKDSFS